MANFTSTDYILLTGVSETTGQLSWTGQTNNLSTATVTDVGNDGVLTENSDSYFAGSTYSGWYVNVNGQHFAVFNVNNFWFIPYNRNQTNLGNAKPIVPQITAGSTTLKSATLTTAANCFLDGTRIATPAGERPVETLGPGDAVLTADGRATPVLWVWRQEITNIFGLGEARAPVCVAAGALGPGMPARDLTVTADHGLLVEGMLVNAGALVNGTTIRRVPMARLPGRFSYWHIETEAHEAILAEGCPAETFVAYTPRAVFDNHAGYLARYGADRSIAEMALPRITAARQLMPGLRDRLGLGRAA